MATVARVAAALPDAALGARADAVGERLASGAVHVVFAGQTNRGKSSLINALLGQPALPTGIVPVTAVPTHVVYGATYAARVHLRTGAMEDVPPDGLASWIAAERNPGNARGAAFVELCVPAAVLSSGLRFIDTPGVGSIDPSAGAGALDTLAHADAVVLVTGADPPISADELAVFVRVARWAPTLIVVMNKADLLAPDAAAAARRYLTNALESALGRSIGRVLEVSAVRGAGGGGPPADWEALRRALSELAGRDRAAVLVRGAERESLHLVRHAISVVREHARRAYAPVAACDDRVEAIRNKDGHVAYAALMLNEFTERTARDVRRRAERDCRAAVEAAREGLEFEVVRRVAWSTTKQPVQLRREAVAFAAGLAESTAAAWGAVAWPALRADAEAAVGEAARLGAEVRGALAAVAVVEPEVDGLVADLAIGSASAPPDGVPPTGAVPRAPRATGAYLAVLPGRVRRHRIAAAAREELRHHLDARSGAVASQLAAAAVAPLVQFNAAWQERVRGAHAEAEALIREISARRARIVEPARRELLRLSALRQELERHVPEGAEETGDR